MADLDAIISNAFHEATGGEEGQALEPAAETLETPAAAEPVAEAAPAAAPDPVDTPATTDDPLSWDSLGFKPEEPGKDNRIPYSRVQKTWENKKREWTERTKKDIEAAVAAAKKEWEPNATRLQQLEAADRLATEQPDEYIRLLSRVNPAYAAYVKREMAEARADAAQVPAAADDPMPGPDAVENGVKYYSEEGFKKYQEWNLRQAVRLAEEKITARFEKEYGPLKNAFQQSILDRSLRQKAQSMEGWAQKAYGEVFDKSRDEIAHALRANPQVPFEQIVADICTPKMKEALVADRNKLREEILAELKTRPAAASAAAPSAAKTTPREAVPANGEDRMDAIIRDAMRNAESRGMV